LGGQVGGWWFSRGCRIENLREGNPLGFVRGTEAGAVPENQASRGRVENRAPINEPGAIVTHDPHLGGGQGIVPLRLQIDRLDVEQAISTGSTNRLPAQQLEAVRFAESELETDLRVLLDQGP